MDVPKHIPAYHKALGIQQKFNDLPNDRRNQFFTQIISSRAIINYLINGRYEDAKSRILKLKQEHQVEQITDPRVAAKR